MFSIRRNLVIAGSVCCLSACGAGANEPLPGGADRPAGAEGMSTDTVQEAASARVPEFGATPRFTTMATSRNGLSTPRDLAFNPTPPRSASGGETWELWVVNRSDDSAVIVSIDLEAGTGSSQLRIDPNADHFMEEVSSIAFGAPTTFGTCQESRNTYNNLAPPNDFMGPTLWSSDLSIFAESQPGFGPLGSHLDMLHGSPLCMGIAHDAENAYYVFDGLNGHIVHYDFKQDHGPGFDDHSDGQIRRFLDAEVHYAPGVPGHLELDRATGWLYVADPGASRVIRLDTQSGRETSYSSFAEIRAAGLPEPLEPLGYYGAIRGSTVETFASNLSRPSGLAIANGRLFVGDQATGEVVAFDLATGAELARIQTPAESLMGLTIGPDGNLWYVDAEKNELVRVER